MTADQKSCKTCQMLKLVEEFPSRMDRGKERIEANCKACKKAAKTAAAPSDASADNWKTRLEEKPTKILEEFYIAYFQEGMAIWGIGNSAFEANKDAVANGAYKCEAEAAGPGEFLHTSRCSKRLFDDVRSEGCAFWRGSPFWQKVNDTAYTLQEAKERMSASVELAEYTASVCGGKVIAQAQQQIVLMDPDTAANFMQTVTRGNCGSYSGDKKVVGSAFSVALRAMTGVGPELPGWEREEDYDLQARCMRDGLSDERKVAEFMQRLGTALVAWCNKEEAAREEAARKAKETKKRKAKQKNRRAAEYEEEDVDDLEDQNAEEEDCE